jgi:hypothetical protein
MDTTQCQCIVSSTGLYKSQIQGTQPPKGVRFNLSIEDYLQQTDNPRVLLACGHVKRPWDEQLENTDIDLRGHFLHYHIGWYTIDSNPLVNPDMIADINDLSVLEYISHVFENQLNVIYVEGWFFTSVTFFTMVNNILKKSGTFVQSIGKNSTQLHLREYTDSVLSAGFTEQSLTFKSFYAIHSNRVSIRNAQIHNLGNITEEDFYRSLIQVTACRSPEDIAIRLSHISGDLKTTLDDIKMLYKIDPFLGYGLSYEFDRWQCYMILRKP